MFKGLPCWQVHTAQLKAGNLLALDLDPVGLRWGLTRVPRPAPPCGAGRLFRRRAQTLTQAPASRGQHPEHSLLGDA